LEKTKTKSQPEIVQAFDRILGRIGGTQQPSLIFTDKDAAFGVVNGELKEDSAFHQNVEREEIEQKLKVGRNDIAPVDAAIFKIKQRIKKIRINNPGQGWSGLISRVEKSLNDKPMKSLFGSAPNEVATNDELKFQVLETQAENISKNFDEDKKIKERLPVGGGFRAPMAHARALTSARADVVRYQGTVREVARNEHGEVEDRDGNKFPAKLVLPVNVDSEQIADRDIDEQRDPRRIAQARPILQPFVDAALLGVGRRTTFRRLGPYMNMQPGFKNATLRANIKGSTIRRFIELFPEHFRLEIFDGGGFIYPRAEPITVQRRLRGKQAPRR
jgi:hypothetical protein